MEKIENNKSKNIVISMIMLILFIIAIILIIFYTQNIEFRNWIDIYIFRKIVTEDKLVEIPIDSDNFPSVYAYSKYITVLTGNELKVYNQNGKQQYSLNINISNPIYNTAGEYLAIAESEKKQAYLISGKDVIWETEIEGNISDIYVNKNGYVAITIVNTSYKTVIAVYNPNGKEIFKKYLATTSVVDVAISEDDSYLAIAEIDTSGILIQSKVEIISIEKAQKRNSESVVYTHNSEQGDIIISINYNSKNYLTCMYDNSVSIIYDKNEEKILGLNAKTDAFAAIDLKNYVFRIEEENSETNNSSKVHIMNIFNKKEKTYIIDSAIKETFYFGNVIGINVGTDAYFVNMSGNLIKKYISNTEIQNIVLTEKIVGVINRDKIKVITL